MNKDIFLREEIKKIGIELDDAQAEQFLIYFGLLTEWNSVMNLTAIKKSCKSILWIVFQW